MKVPHILMAAAAAALMASPALANGPSVTPSTAKAHHHWAGFFDKIDTNHDGKISKDEWLAHSSAMFDKIDANHDGSLTKDEFKAMHEKMRAKHANWHGKGGKGSTSEPPYHNQATSSGNPGGADGAGGWTAQ